MGLLWLLSPNQASATLAQTVSDRDLLEQRSIFLLKRLDMQAKKVLKAIPGHIGYHPEASERAEIETSKHDLLQSADLIHASKPSQKMTAISQLTRMFPQYLRSELRQAIGTAQSAKSFRRGYFSLRHKYKLYHEGTFSVALIGKAFFEKWGEKSL